MGGRAYGIRYLLADQATPLVHVVHARNMQTAVRQQEHHRQLSQGRRQDWSTRQQEPTALGTPSAGRTVWVHTKKRGGHCPVLRREAGHYPLLPYVHTSDLVPRAAVLPLRQY